jgi:hypothetical protein
MPVSIGDYVVHAIHLSTVTTTSQRPGAIGLDSPIEARRTESLAAQEEVWNSLLVTGKASDVVLASS